MAVGVAHPIRGAMSLRRRAALSFLVSGVLVGVPAARLARAMELEPHFMTAAAVVYGAIAMAVQVHLPGLHPHRHFGLPNQVTTVRAALTALFGGLAMTVQMLPADSGWLWVLAALGALALALDGVDGWLSRRTGPASDFGARYDMEVDALLIALLALIAWRLDKAGAWVLAIGALHYGLLAAAWIWRWLAAPLPVSMRRKTICVIQTVVLCVLLTPPVEGVASRMLAAAALALLIASFGLDVRWLYRQAR